MNNKCTFDGLREDCFFNDSAFETASARVESGAVSVQTIFPSVFLFFVVLFLFLFFFDSSLTRNLAQGMTGDYVWCAST